MPFSSKNIQKIGLARERRALLLAPIHSYRPEKRKTKKHHHQQQHNTISTSIQIMSTIIAIDARSTSLTVTWPGTEGAARYMLEYRTADKEDFELLSDKLTQTQARKRNLAPSQQYFFRVAAITNDVDADGLMWVTHPEAIATLSSEQESSAMAAPTALNSGSNEALHISWNKSDGAAGYELQMRENQGGAEWKAIAPSLSGTEVKKKNLTSKFGYQFRVRPAGDDMAPFSAPSDTVVARGLSLGIQRFFNSLEDGTFLKSANGGEVALADALGGKEFVLLYASAHWCPPCRQVSRFKYVMCVG